MTLSDATTSYLAGNASALDEIRKALLKRFARERTVPLNDLVGDVICDLVARGGPAWLARVDHPAGYLSTCVANLIKRVARRMRLASSLTSQARGDSDDRQEDVADKATQSGELAAERLLTLRRVVLFTQRHVDAVLDPESDSPRTRLDRESWRQVVLLFLEEATMDELIALECRPQVLPKNSADWKRARDALQQRHKRVRTRLFEAIDERVQHEGLDPAWAALLRNLFLGLVRSQRQLPRRLPLAGGHS